MISSEGTFANDQPLVTMERRARFDREENWEKDYSLSRRRCHVATMNHSHRQTRNATSPQCKAQMQTIQMGFAKSRAVKGAK